MMACDSACALQSQPVRHRNQQRSCTLILPRIPASGSGNSRPRPASLAADAPWRGSQAQGTAFAVGLKGRSGHLCLPLSHLRLPPQAPRQPVCSHPAHGCLLGLPCECSWLSDEKPASVGSGLAVHIFSAPREFTWYPPPFRACRAVGFLARCGEQGRCCRGPMAPVQAGARQRSQGSATSDRNRQCGDCYRASLQLRHQRNGLFSPVRWQAPRQAGVGLLQVPVSKVNRGWVWRHACVAATSAHWA